MNKHDSSLECDNCMKDDHFTYISTGKYKSFPVKSPPAPVSDINNVILDRLVQLSETLKQLEKKIAKIEERLDNVEIMVGAIY